MHHRGQPPRHAAGGSSRRTTPGSTSPASLPSLLRRRPHDCRRLTFALSGERRHARPPRSRSDTGVATRRSGTRAATTPVSEADFAVDRHLRERLLAARPSYGWLSEEDPRPHGPARMRARLHRRPNSIGSTARGPSSAGEKTWAHSLRRRRGRRGDRGRGLSSRDEPALPPRPGGRGRPSGRHPLIAISPSHGDPRCAGCSRTRPISSPATGRPARRPRAQLPPFRSPTASPLFGEGRFDAMLTLRDAWEWDLAAGTVIIAEAGGIVTDRHLWGLRSASKCPRRPGARCARRRTGHSRRASRPPRRRPLGPADTVQVGSRRQTEADMTQRLHLVFGGELVDPTRKRVIIKIRRKGKKKEKRGPKCSTRSISSASYPDYATAYDAWKREAQRTVRQRHIALLQNRPSAPAPRRGDGGLADRGTGRLIRGSERKGDRWPAPPRRLFGSTS